MLLTRPNVLRKETKKEKDKLVKEKHFEKEKYVF